MSTALVNSRSNFAFKFIYSDVTSMKHPLPPSFSFFFLTEKISKNGKHTVEMRTYSFRPLGPLHLHAPVRFRQDSPSP